MAVESGDGTLRWAGAAGEARPDGTPMRVDTPFFIASIDKLLNGSIVMKLQEDSRLDLDASISTYLPSRVVDGLHRLGGVDWSSQVTVRHLLGHTSGLADWLEDRSRDGASLSQRVVAGGDLTLDIEDIAALVRERLTPHFPPQDLSADRPTARYSDTNFMLLIGVIEAVTGRPLHEVYKETLLEPLNLRSTYLPGWSEPLDPTAQPVALRARGHSILIPMLLRSVRGVYSTVSDMIKFMRGLMAGRLFEHPLTLTAMQERWNRFGFPRDRAALRSPGWPIEYGLSIMRFRLPRIFTPRRGLPAVIGHTGSTGCWLFYCPELDVYMSGSVDEVTAGAVPYRIVPRILRSVHGREKERAKWVAV